MLPSLRQLLRRGQYERGRDAEAVTEIPLLGWRDVLLRVGREIAEDRVMLVAAGVTYYLLVGLVPGLSALVTIYGLVADPATVAAQTGLLTGIIPGGGLELIDNELMRLVNQSEAHLSVAFALSIVGAFWIAGAGVKALFEAMNVAYEQAERRNIIELTFLSFVFALAAIAGVIVMTGVVVALPVLLNVLGLGEGFEWTVRLIGFAAMFALFSLGVASLYRWGPCRARARWRWITPGSVFSTVMVLIISVGFSYYAANFASFDATYGSLGALIGFMTWIWLTITLVIVGGELNAELEHQTARDTTTGRPLPMGQRGATMADKVAPPLESDHRERDSGPRQAQGVPRSTRTTPPTRSKSRRETAE